MTVIETTKNYINFNRADDLVFIFVGQCVSHIVLCQVLHSLSLKYDL